MREVVQATEQRVFQFRASIDEDAVWQRKGLVAFVSRPHWHRHLTQKLESEPAIEFRNLRCGYDGLRESAWNADYFAALVAGRTGWPMVDACVAMLRETGWISFRIRAMPVPVAFYPLRLHWRLVGVWLARQFADYEPGTHWSQMQMQAGTIGINTTRVYNPIKQVQDQDPHGRFARRWLPILCRVPDAWFLQPWCMPPNVQVRCGVRVGEGIPVPLADLEAAARQAKMRVHALRARPEIHAVNHAIVKKHASRMRRDRVDNSRGSGAAPSQLSLDF